MTLNRDAIIEVCEVLSQQEDLKVTIKHSAMGALLAAVGAFSGGVFAGPIGMAVGGTMGSITAAYTYKGRFRSVVDILRNDLTAAQQNRLADSVGKIFSDINAQDVVTLTTLVLSSQSLKHTVIKEIASFLAAELNLQVIMP